MAAAIIDLAFAVNVSMVTASSGVMLDFRIVGSEVLVNDVANKTCFLTTF